MKYTQQERTIALSTPLGEDVLLLQEFTSHEGISQLFTFELDLLSEQSSVPFNEIVGKRVTIRIVQADGKERFVNGLVSHFSQTGSDNLFTHYHAQVVPWLWFLTRSADCRIFQNMTIPNIVTKVFATLGFRDFRNALQGHYEPREYCVQYRETDFNFVSRLMEQYGIFYFFEHERERHTLVLADSPSAIQVCPGQPEARYEISTGPLVREDVITGWHIEQQLKPGKYALTDYNFETPATNLGVNVASMVEVGGNGNFEIYDFPGTYLNKASGESIVKLRMEAEEASHLVVNGAGNCRPFIPGYRFKLTEHYRRDMNASYVITELRQHATVGGCYTGTDARADYSNNFTCIPVSVPFRPQRVTPKPVIHGPQTAVVVGKSGEEIWVDKYGRVKVQFHWDREGKHDENSSCWIRVSQLWAGKNWGAMWVPRMGHEVIVEFLEGDPDQPIITGRVYNAVQKPPYDLPGEQTKSTIKSLSSKGGGGFNELRFEDAKGKEQIFIHAERNQDIRVKKDQFETIGGESHLIIDKDQLEQVKGDKHLHVGGDHNQKVDGTVSLQASMDLQEKAGMKYALDAGMEIHLKAGLNLVIESGTTLTLKVGGNFINLNPAGVFISGTLVMINSGGAGGSGAGCSAQAPKNPKGAAKADPGQMSNVAPPVKPAKKPSSYSPPALVLKQAAQNGTPFCDI